MHDDCVILIAVLLRVVLFVTIVGIASSHSNRVFFLLHSCEMRVLLVFVCIDTYRGRGTHKAALTLRLARYK